MYYSQIKEAIVLVFIFAIVIITSAADILADLSHGASISHIVKEASIVSISIIAIAWLLYGLYQQKIEINLLRQQLDAANTPQTPAEEYVLEARKKLGDVVTQQFSDWILTSSEKEVAWLLLKGLSFKEIAIVRNTQERTVRQQSSSIYKKAGVAGRHAFSAWFIEDIL